MLCGVAVAIVGVGSFIAGVLMERGRTSITDTGPDWNSAGDAEKKAWVKGMLMSLYREGKDLRQWVEEGGVNEQVLWDWESKTYRLIRAAFGEEEARKFRAKRHLGKESVMEQTPQRYLRAMEQENTPEEISVIIADNLASSSLAGQKEEVAFFSEVYYLHYGEFPEGF